MKISRRFVLGLPLALVTSKAVASPATARAPYVEVGEFVDDLGGLERGIVHQIGNWNGEYYPVVVKAPPAYIDQTPRIVPDYRLYGVSGAASWKSGYYRALGIHWQKYRTGLDDEKYLRALRGLQPRPGVPVETFLLDKTGTSWPKMLRWENSTRIYSW